MLDPLPDPLPLVAYDAPCAVRTMALDRLAEAGVRAEVVAESTAMAGVHAAVRAGVGIAHGRRTEEHEPPVGGLVLLDGNRLEIVEQGVEQRLEPGGRRAWREAQVQRRVVSQRCL